MNSPDVIRAGNYRIRNQSQVLVKTDYDKSMQQSKQMTAKLKENKVKTRVKWIHKKLNKFAETDIRKIYKSSMNLQKLI